MPSFSKRSSKLAPQRRTKPTGKPSPRSNQPFLRFYHSEPLRAETLAVLTTLEQSHDSMRHRDALSNLVLELSDSGMEYYFLRPLKLAKVGFVTEQSAHLGMRAMKRVIAPMIRNIIGHMDQQQLPVRFAHSVAGTEADVRSEHNC